MNNYEEEHFGDFVDFWDDTPEEVEILHKYEPKLASAVEHIFAPSYEYTRAYRKFKESRKKKHD